jgi:hypothetical protein
MLSLRIWDQTRFTYWAIARWLSLLLSECSSSLKVTHWEVVPVLLDSVLIVICSIFSKLGRGFSIVFSRVSVSHLLISPSIDPVWMLLYLSQVSVVMVFLILQFSGNKSLLVVTML